MVNIDKCLEQQKEIDSVGMPNNYELPFFAYGFFKPHQLAYSQIKKFVNGKPQCKRIQGILGHVNGIPVFTKTSSENERVPGYIITFKKNKQKEAYRTIGYTKNMHILLERSRN